MVPQPIKDLCHFLARIPHINHGGCAIAALAIYKLAKGLGLDYKLVYLYSYGQDYEDNSEALKRGDTPLACSHACVSTGDMLMDCCGLPPYFRYQQAVTEEFVINSILFAGWSDSFNKEEYLPQIEEYLGFSLYEQPITNKCRDLTRIPETFNTLINQHDYISKGEDIQMPESYEA